MEKFKELLSELNKERILQKSIDWAECLPDEVWEGYFKGNFKELARNIDLDKRRWHETSISVIEIFEGILGIRHISQLYSEISSCEDIYFHLEFFEMEEAKTITYKIKPHNKG